ncbi:hypothetical protein DEU56DRAFT_785642 [Suillus clintonianus]|uniref:uncharacterized protein n=1 Tax=Suillus clintonianus TaxID=1904413 RepID=UPI001B86C9F1|nr:uncharacterized protein DEU56DRAFT_785642 [Suillus clintonianus]KAG2146649.1 hypothetical protein DEU56DRAFT_785642 [Suillus clintonianus]
MPDHDAPRSISGELDPDSDIDSHLDHDDGVGGPNKPGRKKNPNSQAARRDQNRIAQREFRLRKQQRIRDLEARVELLSASQDEALTDCRAVLRDLMAENQVLRGLLKSVSGFIGDGAGGMLVKLGWDMADFDSFVNKAETDTAWESFQTRKHSHTSQTSSAMSSTLGAPNNKRPADDDSGPGPAKKTRGMSNSEQNGDRRDSYPLMMPMSSAVPPAPSLYPPPPPQGRSQDNLFSDLMQSGNSPVFMSTTTSTTPSHYAASADFQPYVPQMNVNVEQRLGAMYSTSKTNAAVPPPQRVLPQNSLANDEPDEHDMGELQDPKKIEAMKLIKYHLDNFMRNSAYCLPASLRPTLVQRTINHESIIDRIIYPELRDRIILLRGQISLADCLFDYKKAIKLHGDDVLAQHNWELAEWWLRKYSYLVDKTTLNVCNRWRHERGEPDLSLSDIGAQGDSPGS